MAPLRRCARCEAEGITTRRKIVTPPTARIPLCATHRRGRARASRAARRSAHVERTYSITEEQYQAILKAQGGVCYICRKKPGKQRLSVDHDHHLCVDHPPEKGCPRCIRGLLHSKCNSYLGWIRDDPEAGERIAQYLRFPPARSVLL